MIQAREEQPGEETHRARSGGGRDPSAGASVPVGFRCVALRVWMCSLSWKLSGPHTVGIFMEVLPHKHDRSLSPFLVLPVQEDGRQGWKSQVFHHSTFFLVSSPRPGAILEPTQSHFVRAKDTPIIQEIPRHLPCVRNCGQRPIIRTEDTAPVPVT